MSESDFNKVFSNNLRYYLRINNMSQLELSKRLGVGTTSVSNWCKGLKSPRMNKVDEMCRIFGCRRSDLMEENVPASSTSPTILRPDEQNLLKNYNQLNNPGKEKALEYIEDLAGNAKYTEERSFVSEEVG